MNKLITPNISLFAGSPGMGKSHLIRYLIYKFCKSGKFNYGIVFCPTAFNGAFDFISDKYVGNYNEELLKKFMNYQEQSKKPAFIIFDDCLGSITNINNNNTLTKLFTCYRHFNITVLFSTQYIYKVPPVLRECSTYCFIFKQFNKRSISALYETFLYDKNTIDEAKRYIMENTENYHFILVNNKASNNKAKYIISVAPNKIPKFFLDF